MYTSSIRKFAADAAPTLSEVLPPVLVRCPAADRRLRARASAAPSRHRPRTPDGRIATRACAFRLAHIPVWDRRSHRSRRRRRRWRRTPIQARRAASRRGRRHCRAALRRRWHPVLACHSKASLRSGEDDEPEEVSAHCSRRTCRTCLAPRTPRTPSAGWGRRERTGVPGRSCPPEHRRGSKSALLLRHMSFIRFFMLSYSAVMMLRCIASGNPNQRSRQRTY